MPPTNPNALMQLTQVAHALYRLTNDPMLPSATALLMEAYVESTRRNAPVELTEQQALAVSFLEAMQDAYLTLFGKPAITLVHEYAESDNP